LERQWRRSDVEVMSWCRRSAEHDGIVVAEHDGLLWLSMMGLLWLAGV